MALKEIYDVVVIGSGPGGLAAAIAAKKHGADDVLIIERDVELGGILLQCIHNGFGLEILKKDLPGPSYAQRFVKKRWPWVLRLPWIRWCSISPPSAGFLPPASVTASWISRPGPLCCRWAAVNAPVPRSAFLAPARPEYIPPALPSAG